MCSIQLKKQTGGAGDGAPTVVCKMQTQCFTIQEGKSTWNTAKQAREQRSYHMHRVKKDSPFGFGECKAVISSVMGHARIPLHFLYLSQVQEKKECGPGMGTSAKKKEATHKNHLLLSQRLCDFEL